METSLRYFDKSYRQAKSAGAEKFIWHTVNDERVCDKCWELDGKTFSAKDVDAIRAMLKEHRHCRCYIEAVFDD